MSDRSPVALAFDLGSSSVRAVVLDAALRPVAAARRSTAVRQQADGTATIDVDAYVDAVVSCLDELHETRALAGVRTVAGSCQWHSLIPLDAHHRPLGPGLSWMDTRATPPAGVAPADPASFHQRTGAWWHGLYWPVRIAWLRAQGVSARRWAGLPEYLALRLLGEPATSVSAASGSGAMDTIECRWDAEALDLAGVDEAQLPEIAPDDWRGRLPAEYARRWPDLATATWSLPVGDGAASAVGACCVPGQTLSVTVGTSAAVRMICPGAPDVADRVWRYRIDRTRSILGVAYSAGGVLYQWVTELVGDDPTDAELSTLAPGAHGLVVLPFHAGHRAPLPGSATGTLHGLRLSTTPLDIVAATLEGVCHELADGAALLCRPGTATPVLGGGAVSASFWFARRLAAAFGGRVLRTVYPEVGALGAAMLATGLTPADQPERVVATDAEVAAMAEAGRRHRRLRALLTNLPLDG
ncbi:MAG: FGGY family carbohydrate kinase [Micromonosporaceae bacterium]